MVKQMTLITLNIWGGQVREPLLNFFRAHAHHTDIFCLQEVPFEDDNRIVSEISAILRGFEMQRYYGQAVFFRRTMSLLRHYEFRTYVLDPKDQIVNNSGSVQFVELEIQSWPLLIGNVHGLSFPDGDKNDNPLRMEQSRIIREELDREDVMTILCGNFNLLPHTKSLITIGRGMRNIVKDYNVKNTSSPLSGKGAYVSDYIFASPQVEALDLSVLPVEVSDHLPVKLDFSLPLQR